MKKILFLNVLTGLFVSGCFFAQPNFYIKDNIEESAKYGDTRIITTKQNRLTNDMGNNGGWFIDMKGVYINAAKIENMQDITLFVVDYTDNMVRGGFNFYDPMQKITFVIDNKEILNLNLVDSQKNYGEITCEKSGCKTDFSESSNTRISFNDFEKIINSSDLEVRIVGAKLTKTYPSKVIDKNFIPNLRTFYDKVNN